jgi:hypothetical protein
VVIEAGELLECLQWSDEHNSSAVQDDLADVRTYAYLSPTDWVSIPPAPSAHIH